MDGAEFTLTLFFLLFCVLFILFWVVPTVEDMMVNDNATWEFHNSVVQDKWIVETEGFPFGQTQYFIKIDNHTVEIQEIPIWETIIPNNTWLGYYTNNKTGEITINQP